jgi:hypothetical protein
MKSRQEKWEMGKGRAIKFHPARPVFQLAVLPGAMHLYNQE